MKNATESIEMRCTIVVEQPERQESVQTRETQTVGMVEREMGVQVRENSENFKTRKNNHLKTGK